jgi:hypothetical protein
MAPIRSVVCDLQGHLIALYVDGTAYQQRPSEADSRRKEWQPVDMTGIDGRVVEVIPRHSGNPGPLVVRLADGRLFEQFAEFRDRFGVFRWRPLELPEKKDG